MNSDSKSRLSSGKKDDTGRAAYGGWLDLALQTSITLAIAVLIGVFGGRWLDNVLGTTPIFTIILVLWGVAGGTFWVVLRIIRFAEAREREEKADNQTKEKQ